VRGCTVRLPRNECLGFPETPGVLSLLLITTVDTAHNWLIWLGGDELAVAVDAIGYHHHERRAGPPHGVQTRTLCCGPGEERRDALKQFYMKLFFSNTVILASCPAQFGDPSRPG
jgi:hypothetical protein